VANYSGTRVCISSVGENFPEALQQRVRDLNLLCPLYDVFKN
jgi:hypothetical protein